ncbi:hypothetical protein ACQKOD_02755 [Bacillus mycoides]
MRKILPTRDNDSVKWKRIVYVVIVEGLIALANELGKRIKR